MKTIAAVTMVFLPGTFVATLLALAAFQWRDDDDGGMSVRSDFWIYWVITIPLTLLTLLIWLVWSRWKARDEVKIEQEARNAVDSGSGAARGQSGLEGFAFENAEGPLELPTFSSMSTAFRTTPRIRRL